jgi:hypothetical protein
VIFGLAREMVTMYVGLAMLLVVGETEFVAFRVSQHGEARESSDHGAADGDELVSERVTLRGRDLDVQVEAVLSRLGFGHRRQDQTGVGRFAPPG